MISRFFQPDKGESNMGDRVYKIIEIVGSSTKAVMTHATSHCQSQRSLRTWMV